LPPPLPAEPYQVSIPAWDDIIHIIPDEARSLEDRRDRRRRRAENLRRSPTPEIVQSTREILTWIDDIQDALVTLSLASRVLVKFTGRILPGARTVATLADALNVATLLDTTGLAFPADKRQMRDLLRRSPASYRARLLRTARTSRVNATLGELLQVLQTTDTLFGVGVSLGAYMAAPVDALFLTTTGGDIVFPCVTPDIDWSIYERAAADAAIYGPLSEAAFDELIKTANRPCTELRVPIPKLFPTLDEIRGAFPDDPLTITAADVLDAASDVLERTSALSWIGQDISFDDHLAILAAQHLALQVLGGITALRDWTPDALLKKTVPIQRHLTLKPHITTALLAAGADPTDPGRLPIPGAPADASWGDLELLLPSRAPAAAAHWRTLAPDQDHRAFADQLTSEVTRQYLWALEGPYSQKIETLTPEALAVELMVNAELPPAIWRNPPALQAAHRALTDTLRILDARRLDPPTLIAAANAALKIHPLPLP